MADPLNLSMDMLKDELVDAIEARANDVPELQELAASASSYTKEELIEEAERLEDEYRPVDLTNDAEAEDVFDKLYAEMPEAVLVPRTGPIIRIAHPKLDTEVFEISAFEGQELGSRQIDLQDYTRRWKSPSDRTRQFQPPELSGTPIDDVPSWVRAEVIRLIDSGDVAHTQSATQLEQSGLGAAPAEGLLDNEVGQVDLEVVMPENAVGSDQRPIIEPVGTFNRPEQEAAWNVLNGEVRGQGPLPDRLEDIAIDVNDITETEVQHVRQRVTDCLDDPKPFIQTQSNPRGFEPRAFFNQLLQLEFEGFTPGRPGRNQNKVGGTRKDILKLIREIAKREGFQIMGDYVISDNGREEIDDLAPDTPFTENRQSAPRVAQNAERYSRL